MNTKSSIKMLKKLSIQKDRKKLHIFSYNELEENDITGEEFIIDNNCNVELEVEKKVEVERLKNALLQLSNDEYQLIRALFFEERSIREYARTQGIPYSTMKNRKNNILKKVLDNKKI